MACPDDCTALAVELADITTDGVARVFIGGADAYRFGDGAWQDGFRNPPGPWEVGEQSRRVGQYKPHWWTEHVAKQSTAVVLRFDAPLTESTMLGALQVEGARRDDIATSKVEAEARAAELNEGGRGARDLAETDAATADAAHLEAQARAEESRKARERAAADRKRAHLEDAAAWVREHGSTHLQAVEAEGLLPSSMALYLEARLALDRPGWIFDLDWRAGAVEHRDIRNPSPEALALLKRARELQPDAELHWGHYGDGDEDHGYFEDGEDVEPVREPMATADFLARAIVLRIDND